MIKTKNDKKTNMEFLNFSEKLISDIHSVCDKRKILKIKYGLALDSDLIESIIYEELALRSRYNYLIKLAKENEIQLDKNCIFIKWEHET